MLASLTGTWKKAALSSLVVLFIYFHVFALPCTPVWRDGDQSIFLVNAERMVGGETLYRDLFQFNLPGTEVLYFLAIKLFGPSLLIPSVALLVLCTANTLLVFSLARKVVPDRVAVLASVAFLFIVVHFRLDATHHWYSTFAVLLSANLIAEQCTRWRLIAAGALLAIATLFSSNRGAFAFLGIAIFLIFHFGFGARAAKSIAILSIPYIAILGGTVLYVSHVVGWDLLVDSILTFPLRYYSADPFNNFAGFWMDLALCFPLRRQAIDPILTLTTMELGLVITLIVFFVRHIRNRGCTPRNSEPEHTLMLYAVLAASMALAAASSPNSGRLMTCAPLGYILALAMLHERRTRLTVWVGISAALLLLGTAEIAGTTKHWSATLKSPRGTVVFLEPARYSFYSWFLQRSHQNDALIGNPNLNFVFGLKNPSSVPYLTANSYTRPEQVRNVIERLDQSHVRFVYLPEETDPLGTPGDGLAPLRNYLREHYFVAQSDGGGGVVFERQVYSSPPSKSQSIPRQQ